jgi:methionyl-tRNA synthetase
MLRAADLALPRALFVHGFVNTGGAKMSKSQGTVVSPVDLAREHGADALRYFLLREVSWGADGEFSVERLEERTASDLANTLGNLLHRTLTMVEKYFGGVVPEPSDNDYRPEGEEIHAVGALRMLRWARRGQAARAFDEQDFAGGLEAVMDLARHCNLRIDSVAPWKLMKDPSPEARKVVGDLLHELAAGLRDMAVLLSPVMPVKARAMAAGLGLGAEEFDRVRIGIPGEGHTDSGNLQELLPDRHFESLDSLAVSGLAVRKGEPLFPRRDA